MKTTPGPRDGAGDEGFTRTRRADEQHAFGNFTAETLEFLRVAQEFDNFLQFFLRFINAGDVGEKDAAVLFRQQLRLRLAKAHSLAGGALHLAHEENPDADQKQHREPVDEDGEEGGCIARVGHGGDFNALVVDLADDIGMVGDDDVDFLVIGRGADNDIALQLDFRDGAGIRLAHEVAIGNRLQRIDAGASMAEHIEDADEEKPHHHPDEDIAAELVIIVSASVVIVLIAH